VFVTPLERQLGWGRADTATVFTIAICMTAFTSWLSGWIYDRRGPSICALAGGILAVDGMFSGQARRSPLRDPGFARPNNYHHLAFDGTVFDEVSNGLYEGMRDFLTFRCEKHSGG
jgi:hypothetical protein